MAMIKRVTRKALKKFLKLLHWLDSDKIKFFDRLKIELETCIMLARVRKENEMNSKKDEGEFSRFKIVNSYFLCCCCC